MLINCVGNATDNLISNESELRLEVMENANEDLKSTQDELVQGQKKMETMIHELLAYVKSLGIVCGNLYGSEGQKETNVSKLQSNDNIMGVVRQFIWYLNFRRQFCTCNCLINHH
jgi:hypothetical protein